MSLAQKILSPAVIVSSLCTVGAAQAQSSYNLYGVVDITVGSFKLSGTPGSADNTAVTKVDGNQMVTSYIGFKGMEDLGDGWKAGFVLEAFLRPDTGAAGRNDTTATLRTDAFWGRAANVYVQNSLGKLTLGRQGDLVFGQLVSYNPFAGAFGLSPAVRLTFGRWGNDKGDSGWSNALSYSSPSLGGLVLSGAVQTGENIGAERGSYSVAANYSSGAFAVGGAWQTVRSAEAPKLDLLTGQRQTFGLLSSSYDFGLAKVFVQYGQIENRGFATTSRIDTTVYQMGASVPVGKAGKVLASLGQSKEKPVEGGTTLRTTHSIATVAYDHLLSKRTDVYAAAMLDDERLPNYKKGMSYALGLRHAF